MNKGFMNIIADVIGKTNRAEKFVSMIDSKVAERAHETTAATDKMNGEMMAFMREREAEARQAYEEAMERATAEATELFGQERDRLYADADAVWCEVYRQIGISAEEGKTRIFRIKDNAVYEFVKTHSLPECEPAAVPISKHVH